MQIKYRRKKVEKITNTKIATISTIITIILGVTMVIIPLANAHDPPWTLDTWAYINVTPEPIGVDQPVFVSMWIDKVPPMCTRTLGTSLAWFYSGNHET